MPRVDLVLETPISRTSRARQLEATFDVPPAERSKIEFHGDIDLPDDWNVGLIVGPSGSGKTRISQALFGSPQTFGWSAPSVVDDFPKTLPIQEITDTCSAVGFNTIPAWLRPYAVLSNGEKFRAEIARHLLEGADPIVVDEFTSVVDRQVAQIGSHAVQKYVRKHGKKFIAVSCHYDIIDWLQPDWIFEPATWTLTRRSLQRRPPVECSISRVPYRVWSLFAPFHYLTAELNKAARCYALHIEGRPVAFAGVLWRPMRDNVGTGPIFGLSRLVTLPDWQGLGLAFVLTDRLAAAFKALGYYFHTYPAHPPLIRAFDRSPMWQLRKRPGTFSAPQGASSTLKNGAFGGRPNAVFRYVGPAADPVESRRLLGPIGDK